MQPRATHATPCMHAEGKIDSRAFIIDRVWYSQYFSMSDWNGLFFFSDGMDYAIGDAAVCQSYGYFW